MMVKTRSVQDCTLHATPFEFKIHQTLCVVLGAVKDAVILMDVINLCDILQYRCVLSSSLHDTNSLLYSRFRTLHH